MSLLTPTTAIKFEDLTSEQKRKIQNDFNVGKNGNIYSAVKEEIYFLTDIPLFDYGIVHIIQFPDLVRNGTRIYDLNLSSYDAKIIGSNYIHPNCPVMITKTDVLEVTVGRLVDFIDFGGSFQSKHFFTSIPFFGIAVNENNIFTTDELFNDSDIRVFDKNGNFITSYDSGVGFVEARGIALNETHIFITDVEFNLIRKFEIDGTYISSFGGSGSTDGLFNGPLGIAINDSNIFVTDYGNDRVQIFDLNGNFVSKFGMSGSGDGQFDNPYGISVNDSNIFVVDLSNHRVQKFDLAGNFVLKFGSYGISPGDFNFPTGISVNDFNIFVSQIGFISGTRDSKVQVFDLNGEYLYQFGQQGSGDSQFDLVYGIAVDEKNIYIPDQGNQSIKKFI